MAISKDGKAIVPAHIASVRTETLRFALGPDWPAVDARKLPCCVNDYSSYHGLEVRSHDLGHTTGPRCIPNVVTIRFPLTEAFAKRFNGNIQTKLIAELEAVSHRFGGRVNMNTSALKNRRIRIGTDSDFGMRDL